MLFLEEWSSEDLSNRVWMLIYFYLVYGLKLNISKSNLYGVGASFDKVGNLWVLQVAKVGKLHFLYLGISME